MKALPLILLSMLLVGCGESVPENPKPANGANSHVSGSPQERIQNVQNDPMLTPQEKEQRIKVIKERNGLK